MTDVTVETGSIGIAKERKWCAAKCGTGFTSWIIFTIGSSGSWIGLDWIALTNYETPLYVGLENNIV